jgi:Ca2+-binding EF-hand superfamily protein
MTTTLAKSLCEILNESRKISGNGWMRKNCTDNSSLALTLAHQQRFRQAMIEEFDLDQDGEINEQEFFAIMTDEA